MTIYTAEKEKKRMINEELSLGKNPE